MVPVESLYIAPYMVMYVKMAAILDLDHFKWLHLKMDVSIEFSGWNYLYTISFVNKLAKLV